MDAETREAVHLADFGSRWIIYPALFGALVFGLYLVSVLRPPQEQEELAKLLIFIPLFLVIGVLMAFAKLRVQREPPVFLPFTGAAPAELPPVDALGLHAATVTALVERAAALREEQWNDVLRPVKRLAARSGTKAARRALEHAEAELSATAAGERARDALVAHVRAAFAAEGATPEMIAPSFVYAAGIGLMARDTLSADELRALYLPFEPVIPRASLGGAADDARVLDGGGKTPLVVAAHEQSITEFGEVYRKLAD